MSELWEEGQDRLRGHGPDAGQCLHKAAVVAERLVATRERANFFFYQGEVLFKRRKMAFKADANLLQGACSIRHVSAWIMSLSSARRPIKARSAASSGRGGW